MSFLLVALIGSAAEVTDVLTNVSLGVDQSSYTNFSNKKATSEALYSGKIGGSSGAINFRGGTNKEGLVTTVSGGKISKIVLTWASGYTTKNRPIVVYAKNEAYASQAELYSTATRGAEIYNASIDVNNKTVTIIPDGEYTYVGFACGNSKYIAFDKIEITWSDGAGVESPVFTPIAGTYEGPQNITIESATPDAVITYTINDGQEQTYTAPIALTEVGNYTIKAKATDPTGKLAPSAEVVAEYVINLPVCEVPTFSIKEGTYYEAQNVVISSLTEGASITYSVTKNDAEFVASTTAVAPVTVELPMETVAASYVITAKAVKDGMTESAEVSATYTLNPNKPAEKLFYMASLVIDIKAGDEVVFVSPEKLAAMTETPDGDRIGSVVATIQDGVNNPYNGETYLHKLDLNQNPEAGVYIVGVDGGNYTFQSKIGGQYLSAPTRDKDNDLYLVNEAATDFEKWTLKEVKGGLVAYSLAQPARLIQKHNDARYGFATYKGSQSNAYIFKYVADLSGVESNVAEEAAVINTIAGGVVVAVSEPTIASVYTVSGQLVANQVVDATATISLANGFYIVKVGNTVKKVIVR